ncbi:MAG: tetratricopeptide repeat protein [Planctomycetota bacterium]|nr:tetratricopeptide repeat protein [Planctomycetota bacterium]
MAGRETVPIILMTVVFLLLMAAAGAFLLLRPTEPGSVATGGGEHPPPRGAGPTGNPTLDTIDRLTVQIDAGPARPDGYLSRGHAYIRLGDYEAATADYTKAIDLGAPAEAAHHARAIARQAIGDYDAALADYDRVLEINPDHANAVLARGRLHKAMGHFEAAAADLARALPLNAHLADIAHELGWAQWGIDDYEGALESFNQAIRGRRVTAHDYFARGATHYHLDQFETAQADLRRAVGIRGDGRAYAHLYLWLATTRVGERAEADRVLRGYLETAGEMTVGQWWPRLAAFLLGDLSEAELLDEAAQGNWQPAPEQMCEAYFYAGSARLIEGDAATAADYFQRSVETNVQNFYEYFSAKRELARLRGEH